MPNREPDLSSGECIAMFILFGIVFLGLTILTFAAEITAFSLTCYFAINAFWVLGMTPFLPFSKALVMGVFVTFIKFLFDRTVALVVKK